MDETKGITLDGLTSLFKVKINELQEEPEFQWSRDRITYAVDGGGDPLVKLALGNVPLDYDLWEGLRNPAVVGLYPAGLREVWEFYANRTKDRVDEYERQTIFQVPRSFDEAREKYGRALIASVMLPFSPRIVEGYFDQIKEDKDRSSYAFIRMYEDVNLMINKATSRVALELASSDAVVVAMGDDNVGAVTKETVPLTHQGTSHGPSKGGNFPQKSLAVLLGLGQFGVSRIVFRDEVPDGEVKRFVGPIRSIVVFDEAEPVRDGASGMVYPTEDWRSFLFRLYDFTEIDAEVNRHRFCSYIPLDDVGCRKCIIHCPPGAQPNSAPTTAGGYSKQVSSQAHRFWDGSLQFDFARCCEKRGQMSTLFPEWSCARCVSACAAEGTRREKSVGSFYDKMHKLTRD